MAKARMPVVKRIPVLADERSWRQCVPALDAAVKKAYGRKRAVDWVVAPGDGLLSVADEAGVYLQGPGAEARAAVSLRRWLGLTRREIRFGTDEKGVRLVHALADSEVLNGDEARAFLSALRQQAPHLSRRVRFGTPERVDAYQRANGIREPVQVEAVVSLEPTSLGAFVSALLPGLEGALARQETRAVLVHDESLWPDLESAVEFHAFQVVPNTLMEKALTAWALSRLEQIEGESVANEVLNEVLTTKAVFLDYSTVESLLPRLLGGKETARVFISTPQAAVTLEPVLAHLHGNAVSRGLFEREGPRAGFEAPDVEGVVLAAASMFEHVGWAEAAQAVRQEGTPVK